MSNRDSMKDAFSKAFEGFGRFYEKRQQEHFSASHDGAQAIVDNPALAIAEPWIRRPVGAPVAPGRMIFPSDYKPGAYDLVSTEPPVELARIIRTMREEIEQRQRDERKAAGRHFKLSQEKASRLYSQDDRLAAYSKNNAHYDQTIAASKERATFMDTSAIRAAAAIAAQQAIENVWTTAIDRYTNKKASE